MACKDSRLRYGVLPFRCWLDSYRRALDAISVNLMEW